MYSLLSCNCRNEPERQGCAQAIGLVASAHLDVVLLKLADHLNRVNQPKKGGFFEFGGGEKDKKAEEAKSTIALAYGYTVAYSDPQLMTSRLEAHVLHNLLPLMSSATSMLLKEYVIKAVDLIGKGRYLVGGFVVVFSSFSLCSHLLQPFIRNDLLMSPSMCSSLATPSF